MSKLHPPAIFLFFITQRFSSSIQQVCNFGNSILYLITRSVKKVVKLDVSHINHSFYSLRTTFLHNLNNFVYFASKKKIKSNIFATCCKRYVQRLLSSIKIIRHQSSSQKCSSLINNSMDEIYLIYLNLGVAFLCR